MTASLLLINNQRIDLAADADLTGLIAEITAALEQGGGFVHIDGGHGVQYDVLITEATHVIIRHGTLSFEVGKPVGPWNSTIDLDM